MTETNCLAQECDRRVYARGLCNGHYLRKLRQGDNYDQGPLRTPNGTSVRTLRKIVAMTGRRDVDECVPWPLSLNRDGYGRVILDGQEVHAHRAALIVATGADPGPSVVARHLCHNPACVNVGHLEWGTHADNSGDMVEADRQARGEGHGGSKLSESDVAEIRRRLRSGESQTSIARCFPVTQSAISDIAIGRTWNAGRAHIFGDDT